MASPLRPRGYEVYTVTEFETEIVHVTSTTWVDPAQYGPTEVPTTSPDLHEKNKSHVTTSTPSVSISETLASPTVSSSISELSVVPSSTFAYSSVETTQQTTLSIPSTTTTTSKSIPTAASSPTTSLPTKSIPKTTSELPTSTPTLPSTSISVPTYTQAPPTTLETSTLPDPTTISTPPVKTEPPTTAPAPVPTDPTVKAPAGGSGQTFTGDATYYNVGMGACGVQSQDSEKIVALAAPDFDPTSPGGNPNKNSLCGKYILVSYKGGPEVACKILDRCPECVSSLMLDVAYGILTIV